MIDLKDPENWNVRMIQHGEIVEDVLYSPYIPSSIGFDELEGYFYHKDFEYCKGLEHEDRTSYIYPAHNSSIKNRDYYSISVSLLHYIKMLKGEKPFPKGFPKKERIESIKSDNMFFMNCAQNIPKEIVNFCKNFLK